MRDSLTHFPALLGIKLQRAPEIDRVVVEFAHLLHAWGAWGRERVGPEKRLYRCERGALLVQLQADEFTRSGGVRLRLESPSAVPAELVTARSSGSQVSDEMGLVLEDLQGSVADQRTDQGLAGQ